MKTQYKTIDTSTLAGLIKLFYEYSVLLKKAAFAEHKQALADLREHNRRSFAARKQA